jgi:hypothetical protein
MSIVPLPLSAHAEARALLHHLLEHGDLVGKDSAGRMVIQVAVDGHTLDTLMSFDADDLEDQVTTSPTPMTRRMGRRRGASSCCGRSSGAGAPVRAPWIQSLG